MIGLCTVVRWLFMPFSKGSSTIVKQHVTSGLRQSDKYHKHLSHTTCTTKLQLVKCKENKLIKVKQDTYTCYVKIKWPILDYKSKM